MFSYQQLSLRRIIVGKINTIKNLRVYRFIDLVDRSQTLYSYCYIE